MNHYFASDPLQPCRATSGEDAGRHAAGKASICSLWNEDDKNQETSENQPGDDRASATLQAVRITMSSLLVGFKEPVSSKSP